MVNLLVATVCTLEEGYRAEYPESQIIMLGGAKETIREVLGPEVVLCSNGTDQCKRKN